MSFSPSRGVRKSPIMFTDEKMDEFTTFDNIILCHRNELAARNVECNAMLARH